jgi:hypothetical protein
MKLENQQMKFPVNALPIELLNACLEGQQLTQAPIEIIFSAAMGALSLACQDQYNVRRLNSLVSPCSLYLITIAGSGERKTTCDNLFLKPIYEANEMVEEHDETNDQSSALGADLLSIVRNTLDPANPNRGVSTYTEKQLSLLKKKPPMRKKIPLLRDVTPEAMTYGFKYVNRSAGLMSAEGGEILLGRATQKLSILNTAWDGGPINVGRKASESFEVKNPRLTINIMIQPKTFIKFLNGPGKLARDNGLLARALTCEVQSTQGARFIRSTEDLPHPNLDAFHARIHDILQGN